MDKGKDNGVEGVTSSPPNDGMKRKALDESQNRRSKKKKKTAQSAPTTLDGQPALRKAAKEAAGVIDLTGSDDDAPAETAATGKDGEVIDLTWTDDEAPGKANAIGRKGEEAAETAHLEHTKESAAISVAPKIRPFNSARGLQLGDFTLAPWDGKMYLAKVVRFQDTGSSVIAVTIVFVNPITHKSLVTMVSLDLLRKPYYLRRMPDGVDSTQVKSMQGAKGERIRAKAMVYVHTARGFEPGYVQGPPTTKNKVCKWSVYVKSSGETLTVSKKQLVKMYISPTTQLDAKKRDLFPTFDTGDIFDADTKKRLLKLRATKLPSVPAAPINNTSVWQDVMAPRFTDTVGVVPIVNAAREKANGLVQDGLVIADSIMRPGEAMVFSPHNGSKPTAISVQNIYNISYLEDAGVGIWMHVALIKGEKMKFRIHYDDKAYFAGVICNVRTLLLTQQSAYQFSTQQHVEEYEDFLLKRSDIIYNTEGLDMPYTEDDSDNDEPDPEPWELCKQCGLKELNEEIEANVQPCPVCQEKNEAEEAELEYFARGGTQINDGRDNSPSAGATDDSAAQEELGIMDGDDFLEDEEDAAALAELLEAGEERDGGGSGRGRGSLEPRKSFNKGLYTPTSSSAAV